MTKTIGQMTAEIREINVEKGWRPAGGGPGTNTWGDYIALLHSEISEALEAYRDHKLADATELYECPPSGCFGVPECRDGHQAILKPEGVGSELADVLIRLLDMCDVFELKLDPDLEIGDMVELPYQNLASFGDWMTWLHRCASSTGDDESGYGSSRVHMLRALVTTCRHFEIDLDAEYERKVAYNRTRAFRHGGREL